MNLKLDYRRKVYKLIQYQIDLRYINCIFIITSLTTSFIILSKLNKEENFSSLHDKLFQSYHFQFFEYYENLCIHNI
jgi:hypothetical protein